MTTWIRSVRERDSDYSEVLSWSEQPAWGRGGVAEESSFRTVNFGNNQEKSPESSQNSRESLRRNVNTGSSA